MWRLYALYGILSPFPQRPLCVVARGSGEGKMKAGGGTQSLLPSSTESLLFFKIIFKLKSVIMLGIHRSEFARWQKKFLCKVSFDNNDRRNIKLKTRQIRGGRRSYVTWRNFWELNEEKRKT